MNNAEKIKSLTKEIGVLIKNSTKRVREILIKIEDLGGFVALGYSSAMEFYRKEFEHNVQYLSRQNTTKDIELMLGLPIGTFDYKFLPFNRPNINFNNNNSTNGYACSLKKAQEIKEQWKKITRQLKTGLPTKEQLLSVMPRDKKTVKTSTEFYKARSKSDNQEIKELKKQNKNFKKRITELCIKEDLIKELQETIESL